MKKQKNILSLGAESAGNFSIYSGGKIYLSQDFGDLLEEKNFQKYKKQLFYYLKRKMIKPQIVLTDLHPFYKTTQLGQELSRKFDAEFFQIQHHLSHIFAVIGEKIIENPKLKIRDCFGLACDGTGYGLDGRIWGGEVFKFKVQSSKFKVQRIGHLENQIMIGGDLAIQEPARMLISILLKIKSQNSNLKTSIKNSRVIKDFIYKFIEKYYSRNQFEVLCNQFQQKFNCQETSSTARILDGVSVLLGFAQNQRNYKHEPIDLLEKNSTFPYYDSKPKFTIDEQQPLSYSLLTTPLFEYLIKNFHRDKKRLAATAQLYLAQGFLKIIQKSKISPSRILKKKLARQEKQKIFFGGGLANNKIISSYLNSKGVILSKGIPRGDAGLSFGQISFYLFQNSNYFPNQLHLIING